MVLNSALKVHVHYRPAYMQAHLGLGDTAAALNGAERNFDSSPNCEVLRGI